MGPCLLIFQMPSPHHPWLFLSSFSSSLPPSHPHSPLFLSVISFLHKAPAHIPGPCPPGHLHWSLGKPWRRTSPVAAALGKPSEGVRWMQCPSSACFLVCRPGRSLSLQFWQPVGKGCGLSLRELYTPAGSWHDDNGRCKYLSCHLGAAGRVRCTEVVSLCRALKIPLEAALPPSFISVPDAESPKAVFSTL